MAEWLEEIQTRSKILDPYKAQILSWLRNYPDMTSAQVFDWLQEKYKSLEVAGSTVRWYVRELREDYDIPRKKEPRSYEAVQEVPMGSHAQVDFGQCEQETPEEKSKT